MVRRVGSATRSIPLGAITRAAVGAARLVAMLAVSAGGLAAQSAIHRTPNISGGWVGRSGQLHFNFVHRFDVLGSKVVNSPTFLLGAGVGERVLFGVHYASNSTVTRTTPNEWEGFARLRLDETLTGLPLDIAVQGAVNGNTSSVDGELTLSKDAGSVRLFGVARAFSNAFGSDESRFAVGGGAAIAVSDNAALSGDVLSLNDRNLLEKVAWSAALQLQIPNTPHSVSLHAANTPTATLQGAVLGGDDVRFGFEFTVPFTMARYFGRGGSGPAAEEAAVLDGETVEIEISSLAFDQPSVRIRPGTTVIWRNTDPVPHSSTSDDGAWDSQLIQPGQSWSRTFDEAGSYTYHCTPHPFMRGLIVVGR